MKVLVTGATGYIGGAVSSAFLKRGHRVHGLARSSSAAAKLESVGIRPVEGDFSRPESLGPAIGDVDAVVSAASIGSLAGDASTFAQDRNAVGAMLSILGDTGKKLIFTSGSAVFGVFNNGAATTQVFDESAQVPLAPEIFAPRSVDVHPKVVEGFGAAMAARVETEQAVIRSAGVHGIVVRPGLVYGLGGSYDIPALIKMARERGIAPYYGSGASLQGFVHIDDLAELYALALERAVKGAILHGVTGEISSRDVASAVSRLVGGSGTSESLTLLEMLSAGGSAGISLSLNKRLSSAKTRAMLHWTPTRTDIVNDIESGSYAN